MAPVKPLRELGWGAEREQELAALELPADAMPGRVARSEAAVAHVWTDAGARIARIPSRMRQGPERPAVGDWVVVAGDDPSARVDRVLDRSTQFVRRAAGRRVQSQVVAANVDVVFVASGLDGDYSPRRIERYLTASVASGARPIILLTKAGLCDDPARFVAEAESVAPGIPVHAIDVIDGIDDEAAHQYLTAGTTAALVGSSGVGKSTLVNFWIGETRQRVEAVRDRDQRGQHTTTARELFVLPGGALVVDTPGMRELALWADPSALDGAFTDIDELAAKCRFSDCRHDAEPGCAVRDACIGGELAADRLESYLALRGEIETTSASAMMPEHERRRRGQAFAKMAREVQRLKRHRR
jgi:ribosome biogenesis GTPase